MPTTAQRRAALLRQRKVLEVRLEKYTTNMMAQIQAINARIEALPAE